MDDPEHDDARERAYAELSRRMAGLRACSDQDPRKLRFFWGSLFVAVLVDQGGLEWSDVERLWRRWLGDWGDVDPPRPFPGPTGDVPRPPRRGRSRRGGRGHRDAAAVGAATGADEGEGAGGAAGGASRPSRCRSEARSAPVAARRRAGRRWGAFPLPGPSAG
ncbi:MAG TPA: hypothetical protein VFN57_07445, partial [Thermomicrobiaceae bacterium]|nr:hypothetical protein [Thermomicrobiaceae bacterium]